MTDITTVDLFCGAGGFSEGLRQASNELGFELQHAVPVNLAKALCKHVLTAEDPSLASYGAGISEDEDVEIPEYSEVAADGGREVSDNGGGDGGV